MWLPSSNPRNRRLTLIHIYQYAPSLFLTLYFRGNHYPFHVYHFLTFKIKLNLHIPIGQTICYLILVVLNFTKSLIYFMFSIFRNSLAECRILSWQLFSFSTFIIPLDFGFLQKPNYCSYEKKKKTLSCIRDFVLVFSIQQNEYRMSRCIFHFIYPTMIFFSHMQIRSYYLFEYATLFPFLPPSLSLSLSKNILLYPLCLLSSYPYFPYFCFFVLHSR